MMTSKVKRTYSYFILVATSIAFPPLTFFTIPLLIVTLIVGRDQKRRAREESEALAEERERRARILAFRSLS